MMDNFSVRQRRHLFVMLLYAGTVLEIDHETSGVAPAILQSHMNFDSVMLCLYLGWVNDNLCLEYREYLYLNGPSIHHFD